MKLNGHSNIEYNLPSSKPSIAKTNIAGTIYDGSNKFWELEEGDTSSVLINAIEIDWNGAKPGMTEGTNGITTTGELLGVIKSYADTKSASNHTHPITLAADSGTSPINLLANTTYKLTAGGKSIIFKTPVDNSGSSFGTSAIGGQYQGVYWNGSSLVKTSYSLEKTVKETDMFLPNTAVGNATQPVYWNGNSLVKTTHTLKTSVPADAQFITQSTQIGTAYQGVFWNGSEFVTTSYNLYKDVPEDAEFTDTHVTSVDNHYRPTTSPARTALALYKVKIDAAGHITQSQPCNETDIIDMIKSYLDAHYQQKENQNQDPTYTAPSAKSGLTYDGTDKQLINAGNVSTGGTMKYSLDNITWSTSIPTGQTAGTYAVYWKIDASAGYNNIETSSIDVTIAKANIAAVTAPTAKTGLTYSGSGQVLINAGSASTGGTMYYKVNTGSFTSNVNNVKGTNAGSYTITYYAKGDSNHNDSQQATITVSIAKINPVINANAPESTIIANGETTTIRVTSGGVLGSLRFSHNGSTSAGGDDTAYGASITPTSTPAASFNITITNNAAVTEQSTIAVNGIKVNFTPSDTTNYNTLSDVNVISQAITLSAAAAQTTRYYVGVTDKTSFTLEDLNQTGVKPITLSFDAATAGSDNYQMFIFPLEWGMPTAMMAGGLDGKGGWTWGDTYVTVPEGYIAASHQGGSVTYDVTW